MNFGTYTVPPEAGEYLRYLLDRRHHFATPFSKLEKYIDRVAAGPWEDRKGKPLVFNDAILRGLLREAFEEPGRAFNWFESFVDVILLGCGFNALGPHGAYRNRLIHFDPWKGCTHRCYYCSARIPRGSYFETCLFTVADVALPELDALGELEMAALEGISYGVQVGIGRYSDPYQPAEQEHGITRRALAMLKRHGFNVKICTKAGLLPSRDFDLLDSGDRLRVTLTTLDDDRSRQVEPGAGLPGERVELLRRAKAAGIQTHAGLSPVLFPDELVPMIEATAPYVDRYCLCTLRGKSEEWRVAPGWDEVRDRVISCLDETGKLYNINREFLGGEGLPFQTCSTFQAGEPSRH